MSTKLHIDLKQGQINVEGDPTLVEKIYDDFKDQLKDASPLDAAEPAASPKATVKSSHKPSQKRRAAPRRRSTAVDDGGVDPDNPRTLDIDLSGLREVFDKFDPKSHPEKLLIFAMHLIEDLKIENPNTDHFYTCYRFINEKPPNAFAQAFRDTANKQGYINYGSATEISVTHKGKTHFLHDLKRKGAE